jgi:hypothetical protein
MTRSPAASSMDTINTKIVNALYDAFLTFHPFVHVSWQRDPVAECTFIFLRVGLLRGTLSASLSVTTQEVVLFWGEVIRTRIQSRLDLLIEEERSALPYR